MVTLACGTRRGSVCVPRSKSHEHRLLIADFLAGDYSRLTPNPNDAQDIVATKRCLTELTRDSSTPTLDCGESGSTRRFLAPIAAALGKRPVYRVAGRLGERPMCDYATLAAGVHELPGNVSSQFVTGLLFALPLLPDDSTIRFTSPLQSRGYVDMTCDVLRGADIRIETTADGFFIAGGQRYQAQPHAAIEGDWSGAAFWFAMNALGSHVTVEGLSTTSAQPDRAVLRILDDIRETPAPCEIDVAQCPDLFPAVSVAAAGCGHDVTFTGIARLRLKECDRVAAMADVIARLGVTAEVSDARFTVHGQGVPFAGGDFATYADHRIAMAIAVAATHAQSPVCIDNAACVAKSYPDFFTTFNLLLERK